MKLKLKLKFPPSPEFAAHHAELIVQAAKQVFGVDLDFSPESLVAVDDLIERFRQEGETEHQIGETLFGVGCYVGEVLVRSNGGQWRLAADTPLRAVEVFPLVDLGSGHFCNPIGKVFKRLANGEVDNLPFFYRALTRGDHPPTPTAAYDGSH